MSLTWRPEANGSGLFAMAMHKDDTGGERAYTIRFDGDLCLLFVNGEKIGIGNLHHCLTVGDVHDDMLRPKPPKADSLDSPAAWKLAVAYLKKRKADYNTCYWHRCGDDVKRSAQGLPSVVYDRLEAGTYRRLAADSTDDGFECDERAYFLEAFGQKTEASLRMRWADALQAVASGFMTGDIPLSEAE